MYITIALPYHIINVLSFLIPEISTFVANINIKYYLYIYIYILNYY